MTGEDKEKEGEFSLYIWKGVRQLVLCALVFFMSTARELMMKTPLSEAGKAQYLYTVFNVSYQSKHLPHKTQASLILPTRCSMEVPAR